MYLQGGPVTPSGGYVFYNDMEEDIEKLEVGTCISDGTCIGVITSVIPMADTWGYNVELTDRVAGLVVTYNDKLLHNTIVKRYTTATKEDQEKAHGLDALETMEFLEIVGNYKKRNIG